VIVYGIKTCGSVQKALAFFKKHHQEVEFIDLRQEPPTEEKLDTWLELVSLETLLNTKGTKYRTLGLKELQMDDEDKYAWLLKEPLLFKRPIIEHTKGLHVGYNEQEYMTLFLH